MFARFRLIPFQSSPFVQSYGLFWAILLVFWGLQNCIHADAKEATAPLDDTHSRTMSRRRQRSEPDRWETDSTSSEGIWIKERPGQKVGKTTQGRHLQVRGEGEEDRRAQGPDPPTELEAPEPGVCSVSGSRDV